MEYFTYDSKYLQLYKRVCVREHMQYSLYESYILDNDEKPSYRCKIQHIDGEVYSVNNERIRGFFQESDSIPNMLYVILDDGTCYDLYSDSIKLF